MYPRPPPLSAFNPSVTHVRAPGLCDIDLSDPDDPPYPPPPPPYGAGALHPAGPPPPADGPALEAAVADGIPHQQPFPGQNAVGDAHLANGNGAAALDSGPLSELVSGLGPAGRLRELLLDGCCLRRLPTGFSQLSALSHLSLMENYDSEVCCGPRPLYAYCYRLHTTCHLPQCAW